MLPLQSALVVLVPEAEELVGPFRERYDPSANAGMPAHVTLLFPFKPPLEIGKAVSDTLGQCFTRFEAFDFSLTTIRRFSPEVLYLAPEPDEPFRQLALAVWNCYPETPPYGGRYSSIVPHLTVAQLPAEQQLERVAVEFARISRRRLPLHATASEIALMDTLARPWQVRASFTLR
jgi:2'-5' RNA ligase